MSKDQSIEALEEINIMAMVDSPYIVKYYDSFVQENTKINIIMEFCEQGDLHSYLQRLHGRHLSENVVWKFFIQICLGMHYLHSQNILHRDLKTLNVFLTKENQIRIGDLGVAKLLSCADHFVRSKVGTPYYLSPEVCEDRPYNSKSDVWSLGCVLYELCTQKHPFEAKNQAELLLKIVKGKYESIPKKYSKELGDIVHSCLMKDYNKRPSIEEIMLLPIFQQKAFMLRLKLPVKKEEPVFLQTLYNQFQSSKGEFPNNQKPTALVNSSIASNGNTQKSQAQPQKKRPVQKMEKNQPLSKKILYNEVDDEEADDEQGGVERHKGKNSLGSKHEFLQKRKISNFEKPAQKETHSFRSAREPIQQETNDLSKKQNSQQKLNPISNSPRPGQRKEQRVGLTRVNHNKLMGDCNQNDIIIEEGTSGLELRQQQRKMSKRLKKKIQDIYTPKITPAFQQKSKLFVLNKLAMEENKNPSAPAKEKKLSLNVSQSSQALGLDEGRDSGKSGNRSQHSLKKQGQVTLKTPRIVPNLSTKSGGMFNFNKQKDKKDENKESELKKKPGLSYKKEVGRFEGHEESKDSKVTRQKVFEQGKKSIELMQPQQPRKGFFGQMRARVNRHKDTRLQQNNSASNLHVEGQNEQKERIVVDGKLVNFGMQNTIKEQTNSSSKSSNTNKFQMSGRLLKSKGEEEEMLMKLEEDDDLREGLNEEDELENLLNDDLRLSNLEDDNLQKHLFLNSQLDIDVDENDFGSELEDPFMCSKQQIMQEILEETGFKENSTMKTRQLSYEEAEPYWIQDNYRQDNKNRSLRKTEEKKDETKKSTDESLSSLVNNSNLLKLQIAQQSNNNSQASGQGDRYSPKLASTTHQNMKEFFLSKEDQPLNNNSIEKGLGGSHNDSSFMNTAGNKQSEEKGNLNDASYCDNRSDQSFEQHSVRNINFSIHGEQLQERVKEIENRLALNSQKCLILCNNDNQLFENTSHVLYQSLNKEEFFVNDFQEIHSKIVKMVTEKIKVGEQEVPTLVNELLLALFKIYYLREEKEQCEEMASTTKLQTQVL